MDKAIYNGRYREMVCSLRSARIKRGLDQAALGTLLGRSRQWVGKVERFDLRLDVVQLVTVCRVLRIDVSRLVRRLAEEEESPEEGGSFCLSEIIAAMVQSIRKPPTCCCDLVAI